MGASQPVNGACCECGEKLLTVDGRWSFEAHYLLCSACYAEHRKEWNKMIVKLNNPLEYSREVKKSACPSEKPPSGWNQCYDYLHGKPARTSAEVALMRDIESLYSLIRICSQKVLTLPGYQTAMNEIAAKKRSDALAEENRRLREELRRIRQQLTERPPPEYSTNY